MNTRRGLLGAVLVLTTAFSALAETPPSAFSSPEPSATVLADNAPGGVVINAANAAQYRASIVPELYATLRAGNIEIESISKLAYEPAPAVARAGIKNERERPNDFLGVVSRSLSELKILDGDFDLYALHDDKLNLQFKGSLTRVYPSRVVSQDKTAQLFRERVRLSAPAAIAGFSLLTFRFNGPDEDYLWIFSPAIKKLRQLTGANRSDGIARTGFAPTDFFSWSGKAELAEGAMVSKVVALVPFPEAQMSPGAVRGPCVEVKHEQSGEGEGRTIRWNFSSRRFPQAAGWLPTDTVFVPRELIRIEIELHDPYSLYGRQILYVDAERLLPIYKFVFDRQGRPWKTVMSAYGEVLSSDQAGHVPYYAYTVVDDALNGEAVIADFSRFASCAAFPDDMKLADFDPRRLGGEAQAPSPSPSVTPTPVVQKEVAPRRLAPTVAKPMGEPAAAVEEPAADDDSMPND